MRIDEAIEIINGNQDYQEFVSKYQLVEWLEELKSNRIALEKANGYLEVNHRLGYNKAIDEYKNSIKEELDRFEVKNLDTCVLFDLMGRKAEKMKAGEEND